VSGERDPIVIRAAGVRKRFRKFTTRGQYTTLKTSVLGRFLGNPQPPPHFEQILDGIDFEVRKGRAFGIVGRNGSGKSTLLKLIAGIMKPDGGTIEVDGRISPLIELGTGFHPEFTGRENVSLNGIVLGMSRAEIDERFESIVDFADLWDSIDDPVRTYSSGMYMRLGFSIAVHASPEILLIDEILAVGDAAFSQKCQQWLAEFLAAGNTVVLVSHDPSSIERWCDQAIWLEGGKIRERGSSAQVLRAYQGSIEPVSPGIYLGKFRDPKHRPMRIDHVRILDESGNPKSSFRPGEQFVVEVGCRRVGGHMRLGMIVGIRRADGFLCFAARSLDQGVEVGATHGGGRIRCSFAAAPLLDGVYSIDVLVEREDERIMAEETGAALLRVESAGAADEAIRVNHLWDVEWTPNEAANR
jgi:lipopolysaccharide transport system ATP-binding protein